MAAAAPLAFYRLPEEDDTLVLQLSYGFMAAVIRELMPVLTSEGLVGEYFTFCQLAGKAPLVDVSFLEVIARHFCF